MQTGPVICEIVSQGLSAVGSPCPATNVPWFEMLPVIPANESVPATATTLPVSLIPYAMARLGRARDLIPPDPIRKAGPSDESETVSVKGFGEVGAVAVEVIPSHVVPSSPGISAP